MFQLFSTSLFLLFIFSNVSLASDKVDPLLRIIQAEPAHAASIMKSIAVGETPQVATTEVLIKARTFDVAEDVFEAINAAGGAARTIAGDIITASVPIDAISALEEMDDVAYIEAAKPLSAKMQYARTTTKVDKVQAGQGTTGDIPYTGTGVIVGVVDSGIDCEHADFAGRILSYWDQSRLGYGGVSEIPGSDGKEYTGAALLDGSCAASPDGDGGHGTHVTGIAAGGDSTYTGVAYDSNIIAVKYYITDVDSSGAMSTSLIDGVNYIFKKAAKQSPKRPAVVNLSIGTSLGAHDNTSLLEQGINNLLIESGSTEKQGRAIVNAAGNEQFDEDDTNSDVPYLGGIHVPISVTQDAPKAYEFVVRNGYSSSVIGNGGLKLDLWLSTTSSCTVKTDAYSLPTSNMNKTLAQKIAAGVALSSGTISPSSSGTAVTVSDNSLSISTSYKTSESQNNKPHATITITRASSSVSSSVLTNYSFDLLLAGTCTGDAWLYPDNTWLNDFTKRYDGQTNPNNNHVYVAGDSSKTITIPGTASRVVTAGSFMDRATWVDINGDSHYQTTYNRSLNSYGGAVAEYSLFTSVGPTAATTGSQKPDISAPGEPIISTLPANLSETEALLGDLYHFKLSGSSMSSPHVAGTVALMLEKNGCLKPAEIKTTIHTTAASVEGRSLPDYYYGYGKLDALAAVNYVTASTCVPDNPSEDPAEGHGCSLGEKTSANFGTVFVALLMCFGLLSALHGTKALKKSRSK